MAETSRPWVQPAAGGTVASPPRDFALAPAARLVLVVVPTVVAGSWLGFFIITELPSIKLETFRATVMLHAVAGVVLLPYLASLIVRRRLPGGTVLDGPLALLIASYLLATATSQNWRVSLEVTALVLMAIGVFYVLSDGLFIRRWQLETALMLAVLAAATWALWIVAGDYLDWLRLTGAIKADFAWTDLVPPSVLEIHGVGDHKNILGAVLATTLPFFVVALFRRVSWTLRVGLALSICVMSLAIFLSLARSSWLAALLGSGVSLAMLAALTPRGQALLRDIKPDTTKRQIALGASAFVLAVAVLGVALVASRIESRPVWLFRESGTPRADVMDAGVEMLGDHPLVGTGPGVYPLLYPEYSGKDPNHAIHAHNGYLQAAVDLGLPGVLAVVLVLGALGLLLTRAVRDTDGDARLSAIACCGALVAFGVFGLLDAPNAFKSTLAVLAAVAAIAVLAYRERPKEDRAPARGWELFARGASGAAIAVSIAAGLIIWGRIDFSHYYYSNGLANANSGHWTEAIDDTQHAVDLDPSFALYRFQLGLVLGEAYNDRHDRALLDEAVLQLDRGVDIEPRSALGHTNLALLLSQAGDRERARVEAQDALRLANGDAAVVLAAGEALEESNWGEEAVQAYSQAIFLDGGLADSPFWTGTPFRESRFRDVLGNSALIFNPCVLLSLDLDGVRTPLEHNDAAANCATQVAANPGDEGGKVTLARADIEASNLDEARALLDDVLSRQPDFGPARTALGSWYAKQGQIDRARQQWVRAGQLHEVDALVLLGDSYRPERPKPEIINKLRSEMREAASEVQFHLTGILYYRLRFFRASPLQMLVPGDWQDAVPGRYARAQDALNRWTGQDTR